MSRGSEAGFTLLEVMVAFVVAAVLLTVAFQVGGESFRAMTPLKPNSYESPRPSGAALPSCGPRAMRFPRC